ncbi:MAG: hypothetical protein ACOZBZ_04290 [Patescibacteria group bacterium]
MKKILEIFLVPAFIFLANVVLVLPLFQGGYTQQMGSIESVFLADARFILENFPHILWNPYWYAGFPFHLFYTPFLPALMAVGNFLVPAVTIASWYRILIGLFYAMTPVSLYFLVRFLTGRSLVGFLAGLFYSFLPSAGFLLPQVGGTASVYEHAPWRLLTLILYGEGGHIVGLFFLPLALLFFVKAIKESSWQNVFLASFLTGLLALANIIALIGFAAMLAIILVIEFIGGDWLKKLGRAGIVFLLSFGLVAFWYNPSFAKASLSIGTGGVGGGVGDYFRSFPLIFLIAPVFFLLAVLGKQKVFKSILIGGGWVLIFFVAAYFWFNGRTMFLPQPNRYLPEMDMGTALLISWGAILLIEKIFPNLAWLRKVFYALVTILIFYLPLRYINQVWNLTTSHKDITQTSEYRTASWLQENTQGERIYASGSSAFWLNTFTNIPQVRGGNDGVANPWILHAIYQINTGENAPKGKEGEIAVWWLRALNASYLVVNLPSSSEVFHDFRQPERFAQVEGVEEKAGLDGDVIYKIPLIQPSLAQIVKKEDFGRLLVPKNAVDVSALKKYVDYIDPPSPFGLRKDTAEFSWVGVGRAKIKANLQENEGIGIQVTYNPGWKAFVNKREIPVKADVIGFMFLDPPSLEATEGQVPLEFELIYKCTWDVWLGYFLTILTLGGFLVYQRLAVFATGLFRKAEKKWEEDKE